MVYENGGRSLHDPARKRGLVIYLVYRTGRVRAVFRSKRKALKWAHGPEWSVVRASPDEDGAYVTHIYHACDVLKGPLPF